VHGCGVVNAHCGLHQPHVALEELADFCGQRAVIPSHGVPVGHLHSHILAALAVDERGAP